MYVCNIAIVQTYVTPSDSTRYLYVVNRKAPADFRKNAYYPTIKLKWLGTFAEKLSHSIQCY